MPDLFHRNLAGRAGRRIGQATLLRYPGSPSFGQVGRIVDTARSDANTILLIVEWPDGSRVGYPPAFLVLDEAEPAFVD